MGASMRYLSQRFTAPNRTCMAVLNDVGSEASEMVHSEASVFYRPACNKSADERFVADASLSPSFILANCHLCGSIFKYTSI